MRTSILLATAAIAFLSVSVGASLAQYTGPPIIIQTPQLAPQSGIQTLTPQPGIPLQVAPGPLAAPPAAPPVAAVPAAAAPARACQAGTRC
jgi:hypothetical protein